MSSTLKRAHSVAISSSVSKEPKKSKSELTADEKFKANLTALISGGDYDGDDDEARANFNAAKAKLKEEAASAKKPVAAAATTSECKNPKLELEAGEQFRLGLAALLNGDFDDDLARENNAAREKLKEEAASAKKPAAAAAAESKDADEEADESGYESPCAAGPKLTAEQQAVEDRKKSSGRGSAAFKEAILTAALAADRANKVDIINASGYAFAQPDGETRLRVRLDRKHDPDCLKCDKKYHISINPKDATAHGLCERCFWLTACERCHRYFSGELIGCGGVCGYCVHAEDIGTKEETKIVRAFELLAGGIQDVVAGICVKEPDMAGPMAMLLRQIGSGTRFKICRGCHTFNGELIPHLGGLCEPCSENRMLDERYARRNGRVCRDVKIEDLGERGVESDSDSESDSDNEPDSDENEPESDENTLSGEMYVDEEAEDDEDEEDGEDDDDGAEGDESEEEEEKPKKKEKKEEKKE